MPDCVRYRFSLSLVRTLARLVSKHRNARVKDIVGDEDHNKWISKQYLL